MLAKDTCSHSLIYTTKWVIFRLTKTVMLTNAHINFLQISYYTNLIKPRNSYFIPSDLFLKISHHKKK
jgi:phenolic acid decarboxylase